MIPISDKLAGMLQAQVAHELRNELIYQHVASWAATKRLRGIQKYFSDQADGESGHAKIVMGMLSDANVPLAVPVIAPSPTGFNSCLEIANLFVETESATTDALESIYDVAESDKCYGISNVIQNMLTEQIEEEGSADSFMNLVEISNGNLIELDLALRG